ncbi:MAG: hypothetical protein WC323_03970 [Patescibacteria group bacterium]|jgi:hypothetical protein
MKKTIVIVVLILFLIAPLMTFNVFAATTDFTADADITITGISFGSGTVDFVILEDSTAESWTFNSGALTVTNPGTFQISCSDATVKLFEVLISDARNACTINTAAGTTYITLPTTSATYSIVPRTNTTCNSLCPELSNIGTYNDYPTCGAATCSSGYAVSGSGSSATCAPIATILPSGGGGSSPGGGDTPTTNTTTPTNTPTPADTTASQTTQKTPAVGEPAKDKNGNVTLGQMATDASTISSGNVSQVTAKMGVTRDSAAEASYNESIVSKVVSGSGITAQIRNTVTNFVTYGTPATKSLGAGERGGVVNSYRAAFGKIPVTANEWNDVIKIANGRWPSVTNATAENRAKTSFKTIYLRNANMDDAHDNAAVTVMAYGLRPADRNLNSEKAAIKSFKAIFGYAPTSATNWDAVRAIAYSGATR